MLYALIQAINEFAAAIRSLIQALARLDPSQFAYLSTISNTLKELVSVLRVQPILLYLEVYNPATRIKILGVQIMTTLPQANFVALMLKPVQASGKPGRLDGVPAWENSNTAAGDLFIEPDGLSGKLTWLDEGTGQIKVTGDADLGEGVEPIVALLDYECLPGKVTVLSIEAGPVTPV